MLHRPSIFNSFNLRLLPMLAIAALGSECQVSAGGNEAGPALKPFLPSKSAPKRTAPAPTPVPAPLVMISDEPYLTALGPMRVRIAPATGRNRRPPLLPTPKPLPTPEPSKDSKGAQLPKRTQPSEFSPDAPPVLLPEEKPHSDEPLGPIPPANPDDESKESALNSAPRKATDLRDAVIYFDTPAGPPGSHVTIPILPVQPPIAPAPESRATYRKE